MTKDRSSRIFYGALLIGSGLLTLTILRPFLITLILAAIFAVVLYPVYRKLRTVTRGRSSLAALLTLLIASIRIIAPIIFIGSQVVSEAYSVYAATRGTTTLTDMATLGRDVGAQLETVVPGAQAYVTSFMQNLGTYMQQGAQWLAGQVGTIFSSITGFAFSLFIFVLALYYLLVHGGRLVERVVALSPLPEKDNRTLLARTTQAIHGLVRGTVGTALIQGVVACIGFLIFGVPNAILWGMVTALAALIPSVGTMLVLVPAVLYLWVMVSAPAALGLAVWGIVAVGSIDNIVGPRLSGSGTNLNLLVTLLSVFGGIALFGVAGVLLGPLFVSITFTIFSLYPSSPEGSEAA